jgi:dTDP-4-dehydrorhamnose 3,5-epimerase-like enzyme
MCDAPELAAPSRSTFSRPARLSPPLYPAKLPSMRIVTAIEGLRIVPLALPPPPLSAAEPAALRPPSTEWWAGVGVRQWNVTSSAAPVLRGMHLHGSCEEVYLLLAGSVQVGLRDLRQGSASRGRGSLFTASAPCPAIMIPRGVLHGLLFLTPGLLLTGRSTEHSGLDEWRCRWDDPGLELGWCVDRPLLSAEDDSAGSLDELAATFEVWEQRKPPT